MKYKIKHLLESIRRGQVMQIASSISDDPWICSVYFVADDDMNLYWLSLPSRQHSRMIEENPNIAVAIVVKPDIPVIGIQAHGKSEIVRDQQVVKNVMRRYCQKYDGAGRDFVRNSLEGKNQHNLYRFVVSYWQIFDEVNFADESPLEVEV